MDGSPHTDIDLRVPSRLPQIATAINLFITGKRTEKFLVDQLNEMWVVEKRVRPWLPSRPWGIAIERIHDAALTHSEPLCARTVREIFHQGLANRLILEQPKQLRRQYNLDRFAMVLDAGTPPKSFRRPSYAVSLVLERLPKSQLQVLDLGAELGKNTFPFAKRNDKITLVEASEVAMSLCETRLREVGLFTAVENMVLAFFEDHVFTPRTYDLIVSGYTASFCSPSRWHVAMKLLLDSIRPGGFFAGELFSPGHAWAKNSGLSFVTSSELQGVFTDSGFEILHLELVQGDLQLALGGTAHFESHAVIARRRQH